MSHVFRLALACLIVIPTGCDVPPEPLNWSSFDEEVIEVGRRVLRPQQAWQITVYTPPPTDSGTTEAVRDEPISATRAAVLKKIKVSVDVVGRRGSKAFEAIQALGLHAVDPLIEILSDDSLRGSYADRALSLLILLASEPKEKPDGSWSTVPSPTANHIFDAVVDYVQRHPEAPLYFPRLSRITRRERIPRVIELIESSSCERQRYSIGLFNAVTFTSFSASPQAFCGNSSPASIDQSVKDGEARQRESVDAIKAWWAAHKNESSEVWLTASLRHRISERTESLKDDVVTDVDEEFQRWRKNLAIREYSEPYGDIWQSSVFAMLVDEFDKAPRDVRPFVLRMIGTTRHPDAVSFIAPKLECTDPNLQHAAVAALKDLKISDHNEAIARILRSTKDESLALEALEALEELAKSEAIEDFTYALDHPESQISNRARRALRPFLVSHAERLWEMAQSHPSKKVQRALAVMLDCAAASALGKAGAEQASVEEQIASTRALLRSDDSERQKIGISLVGQNQLAELLPDVLELIQSPDDNIHRAAVERIQEMGVPNLTIENAPRVMGHSVMLDRHVAAYCYAKYGRRAVPLMIKAAFNLDDPLKLGTKHVPYPAVGLIRALIQEKITGIEEDVIRLVKNSRTDSSYVQLLGLLDDSKSASLVGEFLHYGNYPLAAIRVVRARHLRQHADQLFAIASMNFGKQPGTTQHAATLALIDLDDPRAWQASVTCLEGEHLDRRKHSGVLGLYWMESSFGAALSRLKTSHRDDIRALLREELQGENRRHVVISLTTALCIDPEVADSEVFRAVATSPHPHDKARILAAVALSKLGDRGVIPVLHELIRSYIAPNPEPTIHRFKAIHWSAIFSSSSGWRREGSRPSLLENRPPLPFSIRSFERHHVDIGLALRRLGDETLVDELVEAFSGVRGEFSWSAYRVLTGIIGLKAHDYARQWMESQEIESPHFLPELALSLVDLDVPFKEVLPLLFEDDGMFGAGLRVLIASDSKEAANALEKAFHDLSRYDHRDRLKILDALCRLGDARGIALAAKNPLLLASVVRYLPDAIGVDFPAGHFDYNRIEDAMRVQTWYERHAGDLRWDPESSQFRLANHAP